MPIGTGTYRPKLREIEGPVDQKSDRPKFYIRVRVRDRVIMLELGLGTPECASCEKKKSVYRTIPSVNWATVYQDFGQYGCNRKKKK